MARKITLASNSNDPLAQSSIDNIKQCLDRSLDMFFGQKLKEDIFLHLALKYGIAFEDGDDAIQSGEIEEALFILFDRGAGIIIEEFRKNLAESQIPT